MKKRVHYIVIYVSTLIFVFSFFYSCTSQDEPVSENSTYQVQMKYGEGFAIYLTRDDVPPSQMEALSHVEIAEEPIISIKDVTTYDASTHEVKLTADAYQRISELEVPVSGKSFLVCLDKSPVYWGAFWVMYSSLSFDGITIMKPLIEDPDAMMIGLGYPTPGFFQGKDPRNNLEIMKSLKKAGKLINETPVTLIDVLPHSMKGYELYSWQEGEIWHFTLVTGTNRNKTLEEITSTINMVKGWVSVHIIGNEALKSVVNKLPEGEFVFWSSGMGVTNTYQSQINLVLPDESIIDDICDYAKGCGLDMNVYSRSE
jgi:hypothetical protein